MKILASLLFITALRALAGVTENAPPLPHFGTLLAGADSITVYEGLPHPVSEREAFNEQKKAQKIWSISKEFFYEKPLPINNEDLKSLDVAFHTMPLCAPFRGPKLCGGFHADYAVEWKKEGQHLVSALICFGCHELLIVTPTGSQSTEMSKVGFDVLQPLLRKYRAQRPPFTLTGSGKPVKSDPLPMPKIDLTPANPASR